MISFVEIAGFKRFANQRFQLRPLTLLTGLNGSGKTSLIQALLLTAEACRAKGTLRLNGPFGLELGTAVDVRNWDVTGDIVVGVEFDGGVTNIWRFAVPSDDALYLRIEHRPKDVPEVLYNAPRGFSYLSAERLGPRRILGSSAYPPEELEVGVQGEHCAQIITLLGDRPVEDQHRLHPKRPANAPSLLKYEIERWLTEIARPIEIDAEQYPNSGGASLRFRSPGSDWVQAPNMGFGVSYSLPIVLAGLIAQRGGLVIIENPEAHLHPSGQSSMGTFIGWLAGHGVQLIVETHSDHVLNGVRRAIGEHRYLKHDSAIVHFFDLPDGPDPLVHQLDFSSIGGVSHWPRGFFDQYQIDAASLGRVRRQG